MWKGGRSIKSGYVSVPKRGTDSLEHRFIAERVLGHRLPDTAVVHHVDGNGLNNLTNNLVICENEAYHQLLHARKRRLEDTGSLDLKRCSVCKEVKEVSLFYRDRSEWDGRMRKCSCCSGKIVKRWKRKRRAML